MTLQAYDRGVIAVQRREFAEAREQLALAGSDDRALLLLGQLASNGHGEPADRVKARQMYERAAELGKAEAAHNLGVLYANGRGVAQDHAVALQWHRRSAELGDVEARRMIGLMYATGQGVAMDEDEDEAERYWRSAAAAGEVRALHDLGTRFAYHKIDLPQAASWYLQAAKAGVEAAERELSRLAPKLQELAAANSRARTMLGVIRAFHLHDPAGGIELLTISAEEGDPIAQRSLATAALNLGVLSGSSPEAVRWLRQAAEAGVTEAYPLLGDRLSEQDMDEEALQWYVRGAEAGDKGSMYVAACAPEQ